MKKTIVVLDLIRYSDIALQLEENLSAETVGQFNNQIQSFVDAGLAALGKSRNDVFIKPTGDGAIVGFDGAEEAHQFAHAVHSATEERNAKKTVESARRWFRIGAATGEVSMTTKGGTNDIAGVAVVRAVRLEGAAQIGEFLIDGATFEELPAQLRAHYGDEEKVGGKRAEQFYARRCVMPRGGKGSKRAGLAILGGIVVVVVLLATFSIWKRPSMSSRESKSNQTSGIEGEWTVLSDRNATGAWRGYNRADFPYDLWTNEGSVLRTIHNSNAAPLVTKASFTNFILEFEYQMQ